MKPNEAINLFHTYQSKMDAISKDLKPEIQNDKKNSIELEFREPMISAISELRKAADDFKKVRLMYSDPKRVLIATAVRESDKVTAGDAAIISALPGMDVEMLTHLIGQHPKAGVLLACLSHTQENAELRSEIFKQVQHPLADIKQAAGGEIACLSALLEVPELRPTEKLDIGRRMQTAQAAMTD